MPSKSIVLQYLTIIQIGSYLLLLTKLFQSTLWRKYRYFTFYLVFETIRVPLMSVIPRKTDAYAITYFSTQPIIWLLFVLTVLELFQLVLRNHVGIASLGRKALSISLVLSALISVSTLVFELQRQAPESAFLYNFMLLERLVMMSLLVLVLCLIAFLSYFPVPLTRNVRVHASIFAAFFAVRTTLLFVRTWFGRDVVASLNVVAYVAMIACLLAWFRLLTLEGEAAPQKVRPSSDSEARLLAQLDALNETLLRSARK
ncbi:MAG TPA: hypothetical protein VEX68_04755 [Bryobacteraceae bacterium]|nr:hypothetical protein [Bryobacteraceae bacterium]